jgi:hypothetical protein
MIVITTRTAEIRREFCGFSEFRIVSATTRGQLVGKKVGTGKRQGKVKGEATVRRARSTSSYDEVDEHVDSSKLPELPFASHTLPNSISGKQAGWVRSLSH